MNRHDLEKLNVAYNQVHEKKDSSYLETDMKKRQENNEKARKDMAKVKGQKNPHFESVEVEEEKKELPKNKMFRKAGNLGRDVVSPSVTDDQRQKAYDRSKKIIKTLNKANEEVEQVDEVMTPALIGGTLGAVTGKKGKKLESGVGAGAGAAVGAAMGGPVGAIVGGLVGKKVAEEILRKSIVELENVDEAMSSYDKNRKRAAQRAADRNAARAAGKTGVVPGVGYVTPNKERETYTDEKGTVRHKSGAKNE